MSAVVKQFVGSLSKQVDELGSLNAQIRQLEKRAAEIKGNLLIAGVPVVEGRMYKAVISVAERNSIDAEAVKSHYEAIGVPVPMKSALVSKVSLYDL